MQGTLKINIEADFGHIIDQLSIIQRQGVAKATQFMLNAVGKAVMKETRKATAKGLGITQPTMNKLAKKRTRFNAFKQLKATRGKQVTTIFANQAAVPLIQAGWQKFGNVQRGNDYKDKGAPFITTFKSGHVGLFIASSNIQTRNGKARLYELFGGNIHKEFVKYVEGSNLERRLTFRDMPLSFVKELQREIDKAFSKR